MGAEGSIVGVFRSWYVGVFNWCIGCLDFRKIMFGRGEGDRSV